MKKKISLKDIAARVGVSTALVSYVLNNKKSGRIGKEVAKKIRETALELNYRPNQIAKSLKLSKTFSLGLIVADISNPFFSSMARIIEDEAYKHGYTVIFGSADENSDKSCKLMHTLHDRQVDGFIIAPAEHGEENAKYLLRHDIPFVMIDRFFPNVQTNWVTLDNYGASISAVEHFAKGGNRRPALITYKTALFNLKERKRGYLDGLFLTGIEYNDDWCQEVSFIENTEEEIKLAIDHLLALPDPVDSILFASNILATLGLKYIFQKGIKVPQELALITFDEMEASDFFYAPLTYLKQPIKEMGEMATRCVLERIDNNRQVFTQELLPAELVLRASTLPVN